MRLEFLYECLLTAGRVKGTEVFYGTRDVIDAEVLFFSNTEGRIDTCMNYTRPPFAIGIGQIKKAFLDAKSRGVRLRYLTEITNENISYCKELIKIVDELRHLDGIKGNFMISEGEYLAPVNLDEEGKIASQLIYSNVDEIVEQQHYIFETLWSKAIPSEQRITEIEENKTVPRTEVLYGAENAVGRGVQFMKNTKEKMDIFFDSKAPSIVIEIDAYRNGYMNIRKGGGKIRAFTEITKDNIHYCKELIKIVDELRHLDGIKGGIAVSETEYMATTVLQEAKPLTQVIYSNVKEVVEQGQYIFDIFWYRAIPAEQKIREIEEGVQPVSTRILEAQDQIINEIRRLNNSSTRLSVCSAFGGMQMSYKYLFDSYVNIVDKHQKGEGKGMRWIIKIDEENLNLVKVFLNEYR